MMIRCPKCKFNLTDWLVATFKFSLNKARSYQQHKFFFDVVAAAYFNWPEDHEFQPTDEEHLRAYILLRSGHLGIVERDGTITEGMALEMQAVMKKFGRYTQIRAGDGKYFIYYPLSISYRKLSHKNACAVFDKAFQFICEQLQITSIEQLYKDHRSAA